MPSEQPGLRACSVRLSGLGPGTGRLTEAPEGSLPERQLRLLLQERGAAVPSGLTGLCAVSSLLRSKRLGQLLPSSGGVRPRTHTCVLTSCCQRITPLAPTRGPWEGEASPSHGLQDDALRCAACLILSPKGESLSSPPSPLPHLLAQGLGPAERQG